MNSDRIVEIVQFKYPNAKVGYHREKGSSETIIDVWICPEHPSEPTKQELQTWKQEFKNYISEQKALRKQEKKDILQKLGLNKSDISALVALIQDGNDD